MVFILALAATAGLYALVVGVDQASNGQLAALLLGPLDRLATLIGSRFWAAFLMALVLQSLVYGLAIWAWRIYLAHVSVEDTYPAWPERLEGWVHCRRRWGLVGALLLLTVAVVIGLVLASKGQIPTGVAALGLFMAGSLWANWLAGRVFRLQPVPHGPAPVPSVAPTLSGRPPAREAIDRLKAGQT